MTKPTAKINFVSNEGSLDASSKGAWRQAEALAINNYWNGEPAPDTRHAVARLLWSDEALYLRFDCRQKEPLFLNDDPQTAEKSMKLWEHDVCELFLAPDPDEPRRYAEFEIAPTGEWLDLMVDWTKDEPRDWDYRSGMEAFSKIEDERIVMVMRIPWSAFGLTPQSGDTWVGNMFRQVGSGDTRGYLAWSPTSTPEPQFHVPEKFGEFVFVK
jgi:hypothetical protein